MVLAWGNNDRGGLGFSITWQESPLLIMRPTSSWNFFLPAIVGGRHIY